MAARLFVTDRTPPSFCKVKTVNERNESVSAPLKTGHAYLDDEHQGQGDQPQDDDDALDEDVGPAVVWLELEGAFDEVFEEDDGGGVQANRERAQGSPENPSDEKSRDPVPVAGDLHDEGREQLVVGDDGPGRPGVALGRRPVRQEHQAAPAAQRYEQDHADREPAHGSGKRKGTWFTKDEWCERVVGSE